MKRLSYALIILLLASFLAACGGDQETAEEPLQPSTAETDDVPEADEQPTAETEAASAEEAMAPTEPPAPEPTTEEESDEMTADVAETPAAEAQVEEEPVASSDGWGESATGAQSACDHPYMPLREGATWTYDTGDGSYSWEVTSVEGDLQEATAEVVVTLDEITLNYVWNCAEGQGISSMDFASQGLTSSFPEMTIEVTSGEGEFLLPPEEMTPGASWDSSYEQEMTFAVGEGDAQIEASGTMTTEQTNTVLSADPVTAAGVTVDGVQIEQISNLNILLDMMGQSVEQAQTLTSVYELGRGVGIMRQSVETEFGPSNVELTSFFIP